MSDDGWFKHKLAWLDALAQDVPTRGLAHDIGILLVRRYLHAEKRYAWISLTRMGSELGVARRSVPRAFGKLIVGGWLTCKRGGRGPGDSNHYSLPVIVPQPKGGVHVTLNAKRVTPTPNKGDSQVTKRVTPTPRHGATGFNAAKTGTMLQKVRLTSLRQPDYRALSSVFRLGMIGETRRRNRINETQQAGSSNMQHQKMQDRSLASTWMLHTNLLKLYFIVDRLQHGPERQPPKRPASRTVGIAREIPTNLYTLEWPRNTHPPSPRPYQQK